ncbi:gamma-glutamyl-gamma-aminobutyrate hydrolase family protein [Aureimonas mangrovi]|uniref:gamma-glutamyl-gamma-aminobutyrate hydrolase family protein n=1 Tax=Aureimonas mangrovi TaxID=2758041 RepID=UPI00163D8709|nr:gamma-glutamyl-gamma-aminobutyrate hydrolase family protein [Aureimonas mangrovi]
MTEPLLVAVPADVRSFENYSWHASPDTYLKAILSVAGAVPVIVPAIEGIDIGALLSRFDGVLTTGSATNVHPERYGASASPAHEPYDPARDTLSLAIIDEALKREMPLLAICRGHQEMNVAFGGTLATEIQTLDGRADHRAPTAPEQAERFALRHTVEVAKGGRLAAIVGEAPFEVNSLHRQAVDRLGEGLVAEALAEDGTVEAIAPRDAKGFALGVQWHPEYWAASDPASAAIFRAFGEACRLYRDAQRSR